MEKKCEYCGNKLLLRKRNKRVNPTKKFCSKKCMGKSYYKEYKKYKDSLPIIEVKCKWCEKRVHPLKEFCSKSCNDRYSYRVNLEENRKYMRKYMNKRYAEDTNFKENSRKQTNKYRNSKKGKVYVKEYNSRPEVRKRYKLWKEKNREHVNKKHREYMKEYVKIPGKREMMNETIKKIYHKNKLKSKK